MEGFPKWLPPFAVVQLFDPNECAKLIRLAEKGERFRPGTVLDNSGVSSVMDSHAKFDNCAFRLGSDVRMRIQDRISRKLEQINARYQFRLFNDPSDMMPYVNIQRYRGEVNAKIQAHSDLGGHEPLMHRKLSISVLLNDPRSYEGGRLVIDNGERFDTQVHCPVGSAIVFPSFMMHSVTPITQGTRYVLITSLHGPRFQ